MKTIDTANADRKKAELVAEILRDYERAGDAMRYLDANGQLSWKATPWMLSRLGDAEREVEDDWRMSPDGGDLRASKPQYLCDEPQRVNPMYLSPCFSARLKRSAKEPVPYCKEALRQDLLRVRLAWEDCQTSRDRDAIYSYLTAVFNLVVWWAAEDRAISRARWALQLHGLDLPTTDEPFAMVILCTAEKVDKRTRSKWSRVLRYAAEYKTSAEPLAAFVRRKCGINKCAARFTRCLGRRGEN